MLLRPSGKLKVRPPFRDLMYISQDRDGRRSRWQVLLAAANEKVDVCCACEQETQKQKQNGSHSRCCVHAGQEVEFAALTYSSAALRFYPVGSKV